jgi:hypothetical protein
MYPIVVLSLIAVALLAFGRTREGLAFNNKITEPIQNEPWIDGAVQKILPMIANEMNTFVSELRSFRTEVTDEEARGHARFFLGGMIYEYSNTNYRNATSPITIADIDAYLQANPIPGPPPEVEQPPASALAAANNLRRAAMKAYFIDQLAGTSTGATGTSTAGTPANPQGASSTTGSPAPAPGLYIQLKTQFDTKKAAYDALVISASRSTTPTDEDINQLRTMNRELLTILEKTIQALSTFQTDDIGSVNRELTATLNELERQYSILSENSDKVETLRRIREFEETKKGGNVGIYMVALLVMALAVLVSMVFFQRTNAPATAATVRPPSMANLT